MLDRALAWRIEHLVVASATATLLLTNLAQFSYAPILQLIIDELGLSYVEAGLLTFAFFLTYAAFQVPIGYIVDRLGPRLTITVGAIAVGVSNILFSFSNGLTDALMAKALNGLAFSWIFVPGIRVVGSWFPRDKRGLAIGLFGLGGGGIGLAGLLTPPMAISIGWRPTVTFLSLIVIAYGFMSYLLIADPPSMKGIRAGGDRINILKLTVRPDMIILGVNQFARFGVVNTFQVWLATYLLSSKGFTLTAAGTMLMIASLAGFPANVIGGALSDKLKNRLSVVISSWAILAAGFPTLVIMNDYTSLAIISSLISWSYNSLRGPLFATIPEITEAREASVATGLQNLWANLGAMTLPLMLGIAKDYSGVFDYGWFSLSLISVGAMLATLYLILKGRV